MRTRTLRQDREPRRSSANLKRADALRSATNHHPILHLQRTIGNQGVLQLLKDRSASPEVDPRAEADPTSQIRSETGAAIQPLLAVNAPDDIYEQEADHIAEQVRRMREPKLKGDCDCGGGCTKCQSNEQESHGHLQTKHVGFSASGQTAAPPIVNEVLASPGQPLDASARAFFEPRFGQDLSDVRIHPDAKAQESAQSLNAVAYTAGKHIVLGKGQYAPNSTAGQRLLAHELTHVMQQQSATSPVALQRETQEKDPRKLQIVREDAPRHVRVTEVLLESLPSGGTARTDVYWVDFEVDARGVLRASVRTVSEDRRYRSGTLRFGEEFRNALEHFEENGVRVTSFEGDWSYMSKDEISDNLKAFKKGLAKGMTREKAAQGTPTGKVLAKSGFEVTHVENVLESQEHLVEEGVRRWRVKAIFRRPPTPMTPPAPPVSGTGPSEPVKPVTAREVVVEPSTGAGKGGGARSAGTGRGGVGRSGSGGRGGGVRGGRGGGFGLGAVAAEIMHPERRKQEKAEARAEAIAEKLARYDKQIDDRVKQLKPDIAAEQLIKDAKAKVYVNVVYEVHHFEFSDDVYLKSVKVSTQNLNQKRRFSTVLPEKGWATGWERDTRRDVDEHTYSVEVAVYSEAELEYFGDLAEEYQRTKRTLAMFYDETTAQYLAKLRKQIVDSFGPNVWFLKL